MKRRLIFLIAFFLVSTLSAQEVMKQTGGEQNFEVLFAPIGNSPIGMNGIKYRKFSSPTSAFRITSFVGFGLNTTMTPAYIDGKEEELKKVKSHFDISLQPGLEWHLIGTDRISPYYGIEAMISFNSSKTNSDETYYYNAYFELKDEGSGYKNITTENNKRLGIGANAFAGVDFYISRSIYLGAELGFGILFSTRLKTEIEDLDWENNIVKREVAGGSTLDIGPVVIGAMRLGVLF